MHDNYKLAIIGSRTFNDQKLFDKTLAFLKKPAMVVSGGAKGADSFGESYADANNIPKLLHLPDWEKHGKAAGFIRNEFIVRDCDVVLAFWDGKSNGTRDSLNHAKKYKKPTIIIYYEN
jgi:hypothetical protein